MTTPVRAGETAPRSGRCAPVLCGLLLPLGHAVTAYVILLAYLADPAGPWDTETVVHSQFASGPALALTAVMAGLTWVFVAAELLRKRWYAVPAVLALAALLRWTLLAPEL
ncbi:hypothetical protein [Streptomyces sp. NPDC050538]|uniref:hypothetical protein n=1 Tax=Streptomyces sp. NPDC050538 TaxID=3365627 RepID=UPI00379F6017